MECSSVCHEKSGYHFKVLCPSKFLVQKLFLFSDGRLNKKYKDICEEPSHYARVAYNNEPGAFEVDEKGNMLKYRGPTLGL